MADLYKDLQGVAADVIKQFSQGTVEYVEIVPGDGPIDDPGQPREVPHPLDATVRGASFRYLQSGVATAGDLQTTIAVPDFEISGNGFIRIGGEGGKTYKIRQIDPKPAAGTPVTYVIIFGAD